MIMFPTYVFALSWFEDFDSRVVIRSTSLFNSVCLTSATFSFNFVDFSGGLEFFVSGAFGSVPLLKENSFILNHLRKKPSSFVHRFRRKKSKKINKMLWKNL